MESVAFPVNEIHGLDSALVNYELKRTGPLLHLVLHLLYIFRGEMAKHVVLQVHVRVGLLTDTKTEANNARPSVLEDAGHPVVTARASSVGKLHLAKGKVDLIMNHDNGLRTPPVVAHEL
jgi:hypothetical protein